MPRKDGTGPEGEGPMTGRKEGPCNDKKEGMKFKEFYASFNKENNDTLQEGFFGDIGDKLKKIFGIKSNPFKSMTPLATLSNGVGLYRIRTTDDIAKILPFNYDFLVHLFKINPKEIEDVLKAGNFAQKEREMQKDLQADLELEPGELAKKDFVGQVEKMTKGLKLTLAESQVGTNLPIYFIVDNKGIILWATKTFKNDDYSKQSAKGYPIKKSPMGDDALIISQLIQAAKKSVDRKMQPQGPPQPVTA